MLRDLPETPLIERDAELLREPKAIKVVFSNAASFDRISGLGGESINLSVRPDDRGMPDVGLAIAASVEANDAALDGEPVAFELPHGAVPAAVLAVSMAVSL